MEKAVRAVLRQITEPGKVIVTGPTPRAPGSGANPGAQQASADLMLRLFRLWHGPPPET